MEKGIQSTTPRARGRIWYSLAYKAYLLIKLSSTVMPLTGGQAESSSKGW